MRHQERDRVHAKNLRDSTTSLIFREGFALGLEVHRLQEVIRGQCDILPAQLEPASESAAPAPENLLQNQIKSLTDLIKEPWCDLQHGRCWTGSRDSFRWGTLCSRGGCGGPRTM